MEQKSPYEKQTVLISRSAYKLTSGRWELIADFAAATVWRVNREAKTVETIGLEEYLKKMGSRRVEGPEQLSGSGTFAGLTCEKYSYSYTAKDPRTAGGWGGGESCYTKAIGLPEPHRRQFLRWLKATQGSKGEFGFELWARRGVDGPARVTLETVRAFEAPVSKKEFLVPADFKRIAFHFER